MLSGYRFNKDIALFSAVVLADLKHRGDKQSVFKLQNLLKRALSLERLVSDTFRPIIGNTVHLSNDVEAVKKWSELNNKNVILWSVDVSTQSYTIEFDTQVTFEGIELLKTTENDEVY